MAAEVVETSRRYGRTVAQIDPQWIESLAGHLTKSRYADPHWSKKRQSVVASEHVALWGLPIVSGRRVNYGRIDPELSRTLFIQDGLAAGTLEGNFEFLHHNQWLMEQIQTDAAKTRRRDLIVDPHQVELFYLHRLPPEAVDKTSLAAAIKSSPDLDPKLRMTRSDLLPDNELQDSSSLFPDQVKIGSMQVPIEYRFSPGESNDGATVRIPIEGIGQLDDVQSGWLVPGLLESRIVALIRSLPKSIRRNLVPAPETARKVVEEIEFGQGSFFTAVARQLSRYVDAPIDPAQFAKEKLDDYLHVNLQVVDQQGAVVAQARTVSELRSQLGPEYSSSLVEIEDEHWNQDGLTDWIWGEFPREVNITRGGTSLSAFPTIVDQQTAVGLRLSDSQTASDAQSRIGLMRLFQIINRKAIKSQVNWLPDLDQHSIHLSRLIPSREIKSHLGDLITRIAFVDREKIPRSEADFRTLQSSAVERIGIATQDVAKWLPKFTGQLHQVYLGRDELSNRFASAKGDLQKQLKHLLPERFLMETSWNWLLQMPRYLEGMNYRMEKLPSTDVAKDRAQSDLVGEYWQRYETARDYQQRQALVDPELETFRFMLEEFRISLFAQPLGTSVKVSVPRLDKQWAKVTLA